MKKYQKHPDRWVDDILGVHLWSKQRQIIKSVFENRRTVVRSCHSAGKTFTAATAALAFMYLKAPSKVITTAPTWYQVKDLLWSEINTLYKQQLAPLDFPGTIQTTRLNVTDEWFATGISPRDSVNFQGFHQKHILVIFDEAPGVRPDIIAGADSLMASGDAHCLWIGNPTESSGHFYDAFSNPAWTKFHIGYQDTPNFTKEPVPKFVADQLLNSEWVEEKRTDWGEDSPLFISRAMGDFPSEGESQLIPLSLVESAQQRKVEPKGDKTLGVDVARYGSDQSVYMICHGDVIAPNIEVDTKRGLMEVTGRAVAIIKREAIRGANVDVIGLGAGVVDRMIEQKIEVNGNKVKINGVNVALPAEKPERFMNKRTEMWFYARQWLETGSIPVDDRLARDLTSPRYTYTSRGQYALESKDEMKKRTGKSPDFGDAFVLSIIKNKQKTFIRFL